MGEDGPCGGHRIWPCKIEDTYIVHIVCRYIFIYTHKVDNDATDRGSVDHRRSTLETLPLTCLHGEYTAGALSRP